MRLHRDRQASFADIELSSQDIRLNDTLQAVNDFLSNHPGLVNLVYKDLIKCVKNPETGRKGIDAEKVLRSFALKKIKNWSLRELQERIKNGLDLRLFTTFRFDEQIPSYKSFDGAFIRLMPATVYEINMAIVDGMRKLGIETGDKIRMDTTVVESDIHYPTDSSLLWDSVRVISRLVFRLGEMVPDAVSEFADRTRRAKKRNFEIARMTANERKRSLQRKYEDLIKITWEVVESARTSVTCAGDNSGVSFLQAGAIQGLSDEINHYCDLAARVIDQAQRRVFAGEDVAPDGKIVSIFEPHTDIIIRGKIRHGKKITEFGHKVFIAEGKSGLITDYEVLDGNPTDDIHVIPWLKRHKERFGKVPGVLSTDRGFFSEENIHACRNGGIKLVCIPQKGGKKHWKREEFESSARFKEAQAFRAGVEGRISVLLRGRGMKRCLEEGRERFETSVGLAVLANNLLMFAKATIKKSRNSKKT